MKQKGAIETVSDPQRADQGGVREAGETNWSWGTFGNPGLAAVRDRKEGSFGLGGGFSVPGYLLGGGGGWGSWLPWPAVSQVWAQLMGCHRQKSCLTRSLCVLHFWHAASTQSCFQFVWRLVELALGEGKGAVWHTHLVYLCAFSV